MPVEEEITASKPSQKMQQDRFKIHFRGCTDDKRKRIMWSVIKYFYQRSENIIHDFCFFLEKLLNPMSLSAHISRHSHTA